MPFSFLVLAFTIARCNTSAVRNTPRTQEEKLPLHHAAAEGAPLDVMQLLLDANLEAVNAADKVRR